MSKVNPKFHSDRLHIAMFFIEIIRNLIDFSVFITVCLKLIQNFTEQA